jgi:hypothetical protein
MPQYQGGSGLGKSIIASLLGEWFDERKTAKETKKQEEDLSKVNEYIQGLGDKGQGIPLRKDEMTSTTGVTGGPIKPELKAEYLMATPGITPTAENVRKTGADIYQAILTAKGKVGTTAPDVFVGGAEGDPSKAQVGYVDESGVYHAVGSPRQQFADPGTNRDIEERKLKSLDDYRNKRLTLEEARINTSKENAKLRASNQNRNSGLSATERKAVYSNAASIKQIDDAIAKVKARPQSFGLDMSLGDAVNQRYDPEGVSHRAAIADIGSLKRHDRSGAAVTVGETPYLTPFIPTTTDKAEAIIAKLESLKRNYNLINNEITGVKEPNAPAQPPAVIQSIGKGKSGAEYIVINGKTYKKKVQ